MYLATSTRRDISFAVGHLSTFVSRPTRKHCGAVKKILRYLVGTPAKGIVFKCTSRGEVEEELSNQGYCDSDWGNDPETRKT